MRQSVAEFAARVEALDGRVHVTDSLAQAQHVVKDLVGADTVARWDDEILQGIGTDAPPETAGVSLIVADVAVVETGAIGFAHRPGRSRAAGLLPDRQIALLHQDDLVRSMPEALSRWFSDDGVRAANVVFAAGPSRTADIEQTMMLGVHAPRSLEIVLYRPCAPLSQE